MAYIGDFNANDIEPSDFSALPTGDYVALISNSEWRDSKAGSQYLAITYQIVDGPYKGRYIWHNMNLHSDNSVAKEISQRDLSAMCRACGRMAIRDSIELHDIPHKIRVAYVPAKGEWPEKNQIRKWESLSAAPTAAPAPQAAARTVRQAPPAAPAPAPQAAPKAPPAAVAGKPWAKSTAQEAAETVNDGIPF